MVQFCDDPPPPKKKKKNNHKIFRPQKIFIFLKTSKNIEIQSFEPPKNDPSLRMYENIRVPPPPSPPGVVTYPISTKVLPFIRHSSQLSSAPIVCSYRLLMLLGSIYCKQFRPRSDYSLWSKSDCSLRSSLIRVHSVCFHDKI